jgi:hypothetical protein
VSIGITISFVEGGSGKGEQRGIGKGPAHIQREEAVLCTMSFIGQDNDVLGL